MAKLIIFVPGSLTVNGHRIREFKWSVPHKAHIWLGREVEDSEFNAEYAKALKTNADLNPRVRVIEVAAPVVVPFVAPPVELPKVAQIAQSKAGKRNSPAVEIA